MKFPVAICVGNVKPGVGGYSAQDTSYEVQPHLAASAGVCTVGVPEPSHLLSSNRQIWGALMYQWVRPRSVSHVPDPRVKLNPDHLKPKLRVTRQYHMAPVFGLEVPRRIIRGSDGGGQPLQRIGTCAPSRPHCPRSPRSHLSDPRGHGPTRL